ncbi:dehydrogenase [Mycobacterium tuberculosis]|nr:dehydrogenase [Mycobacterium tuberculosis]
MTGYDAIVIGAGHNGLTAAVLLQRAGLRTACLDAKRYAGGMASTVELFDGYRFEIAGSVQFPTSSAVSSELGLDSLPTVDLEVMSVALRGVGDDPVVQFTDPTKMLTHLHRVHGADAVTGMAGLLAWSQAPTRALGRFEAGTLPKSFDEMYACATNEFERSAIDDMLFGSVTDVLDRHFPDREKHGALRGSMTVLAVNTLYRGPATPGSAAALAFGLGVPEGDFVRWKKLRGGIGALTTHLSQLLERTGGEVRLRSKVTEIVVDNSRSSARVRGVRTAAGDTLRSRSHRPSRRPTRHSTIRACRHRWAFSVHRSRFSSSGRIAGVGSSRPIRPWCCRSRRCMIPAWPRRVSRPRRRSQCGSRSRVAQNTEGTAGQRSKWGRT